jgi:lipoate-protein ligase A
MDAKTLELNCVALPIIRALGLMGIQAALEGRNDILVGGHKISGIAQYARGGNKLCTHASLLYDADLETLAKVLRPDEDKIQSKAIRSVRSRVSNIAPHMNPPRTMREFMEELEKNIFPDISMKEYRFTDKDIAEIEKIKDEKYANPKWTYGNTPRYSFHNQRRYPYGRIDVFLDVVGGIVRSCRIRGDFLSRYPIKELEERLKFRPYHRKNMIEALESVELEPYLGRISQSELLQCLFTGGNSV